MSINNQEILGLILAVLYYIDSQLGRVITRWVFYHLSSVTSIEKSSTALGVLNGK